MHSRSKYIYAFVFAWSLASVNADEGKEQAAKMRVALSEWREISVTFIDTPTIGERTIVRSVWFDRRSSKVTFSTGNHKGTKKTSVIAKEIDNEMARRVSIDVIKHAENSLGEVGWLEKLEKVERTRDRAAIAAFKTANPPPKGGHMMRTLSINVSTKTGSAYFSDHYGDGKGVAELLKWLNEIEDSLSKEPERQQDAEPNL